MVNEAINETIALWNNRPEHIIHYAWGYRWVGDDGSFVVGANHGRTFFEAGTVIDIARVCGCSYYLDIHENADGEDTPVVHVY